MKKLYKMKVYTLFIAYSPPLEGYPTLGGLPRPWRVTPPLEGYPTLGGLFKLIIYNLPIGFQNSQTIILNLQQTSTRYLPD